MVVPNLTASTGPAISGGNPNNGPASDGAFSVYFGGRKSALQTLETVLPMFVVLGVLVWLTKKKK